MASDGAHTIALGARLMGWELEDVENPFVAQLHALGWTHVEGSIDDPTATNRVSFAEVIQEPSCANKGR